MYEQRGEHESQRAAVVSIADKLGCIPQTVLTWARQHVRDAGQLTGVTTAEQDRVKALEREVCPPQLTAGEMILKTSAIAVSWLATPPAPAPVAAPAPTAEDPNAAKADSPAD